MTALGWLLMLLGSVAVVLWLRLRDGGNEDGSRAQLLAFQQALDEAKAYAKANHKALTKPLPTRVRDRAGDRVEDWRLTRRYRALNKRIAALAQTYSEWRQQLLGAQKKPLDDPEGLVNLLDWTCREINPEKAPAHLPDLIDQADSMGQLRGAIPSVEYMRGSRCVYWQSVWWLRRHRPVLLAEYLKRRAKPPAANTEARCDQQLSGLLPLLRKALPVASTEKPARHRLIRRNAIEVVTDIFGHDRCTCGWAGDASDWEAHVGRAQGGEPQ
jgi:hypothetical protein